MSEWSIEPALKAGGCLTVPLSEIDGRVAERFKALVLNTSEGATPPWVRIPPLPISMHIWGTRVNAEMLIIHSHTDAV